MNPGPSVESPMASDAVKVSVLTEPQRLAPLESRVASLAASSLIGMVTFSPRNLLRSSSQREASWPLPTETS